LVLANWKNSRPYTSMQTQYKFKELGSFHILLILHYQIISCSVLCRTLRIERTSQLLTPQ